ncbi:hypothetical protein GCM10009682_21220 [Luedemannella flava]|uniref:Uncharacterized protein n=1 Tax=Luedemannella flava TaxID=349316 RepID=A0ABN2LTX2_9ACTN
MGAGVCAVLVAVVGVLVVTRGDEPVDMVRDYLSALREGRLDAALRAANVDGLPTGEQAGLLDAATLRGGWRVGSLEAESTSRESPVVVRVTLLDDADHPTVARSGEGRFTVVRDGGDWRIENPFHEVTFADSALGYIEINGFTRPRGKHPYLLFPGIYQPYAAANGAVTVAAPPLVALPGQHTRRPYVVEVRVTAAGNRSYQALSDIFFDGCAAARGCGFTPLGDYYRVPGGVVRSDKATGVRATIVRRPEVNLPGVMSGGSGLFGQVTVPGEVRLTGRGAPAGGNWTAAFAQTCLIRQTPLVATIAADGTITTNWTGDSALRAVVSCY